MKRVVVTGGNGHLGYNLALALLKRDFEVTVTVRDLQDETRTGHLKALKNIRLVEANLLNRESLEAAFEGQDGIFHAAAPNLIWSENPQKKIVEPIVEGTKNVFEAAYKKNVTAIIFTSSCSAVGMNGSTEKPLTEELWNENPTTPLIAAKIQAEKWAWEFVQSKKQMRLASICPPAIVGPGFHRHTPNTAIYQKFLENKFPPLPKMGFHLADARDVAEAHVLAYMNPQSRGRFIVAGEYFEPNRLNQTLKSLEPTRRVSNVTIPRALLYAVCGADWMSHRMTGKPRQLTAGMVSEFAGKYQKVSIMKAQTVLGWKHRPADQTLRDTLDWIKMKFLQPGL